jgi:5,10-methylenetetrahydromethanopterin reductase
MKISAQFATSPDSDEHIAIAEQLGYDRAWLFDTPQQGPDVWMMLALAARRTSTIGLGPGVLVPTLRHPMVNASATAALVGLAAGRVAVAFGTGFTGARAMGARPATWSYLRDYVVAFRGLLAGDTVTWQGSRMKMMHPAGFAPQRPIHVPVLISAIGPKGLDVATELADGLFSVGHTRFAAQFEWASFAVHGTVLADGEALDSPRVRAAAGHILDRCEPCGRAAPQSRATRVVFECQQFGHRAQAESQQNRRSVGLAPQGGAALQLRRSSTPTR